MVDLVSVCIPAWNEERSIGTTLESVLAQSRRNIEVLVCANACTDRTAEVVRDYEGRDSRVRLIETPERGKPNAWNILMRESQSNYVVFCDADVFLEPEAVEAICRRLEKDDKTGITGVINYICRDSDHLTQLLFLKNEKNFIPTKDYFCGGLYGINKKRLLERMRQFGLDKMPNEIITDDFFLAVLIGEADRDLERGAIAYHLAPNLQDFIAIGSRNQRGRRQIMEQFPELRGEASRIQNTYGRMALLNRAIYGLSRIAGSNDLGEAYYRALSFLLKAITTTVIQSKTGKGEIGPLASEWCVARSTKMPIYSRSEKPF